MVGWLVGWLVRWLGGGEGVFGRGGGEDGAEDAGAFVRGGPAGLGEVFQHGGEDLGAEQAALVDGVAGDQARARLPTLHLIEKEIAQPIENDSVRARLHGLGHVALHAGDDVRAGAAQIAKFGHLIRDRPGVVGLVVLQFHGDDVHLGAEATDVGQDAVVVVVEIAGARLRVCGPGRLWPPGQGGDEGKGVAVILPQQGRAGFVCVQAGAVDGDAAVAVEGDRFAGAVAAKIVDMVAAQAHDIHADGLQRRPIGVIGAEHQIHVGVVDAAALDEGHFIADMGDVGGGEGVGDDAGGVDIPLLLHLFGGAARHGGDAGHDQLRQAAGVAVGEGRGAGQEGAQQAGVRPGQGEIEGEGIGLGVEAVAEGVESLDLDDFVARVKGVEGEDAEGAGLRGQRIQHLRRGQGGRGRLAEAEGEGRGRVRAGEEGAVALALPALCQVVQGDVVAHGGEGGDDNVDTAGQRIIWGRGLAHRHLIGRGRAVRDQQDAPARDAGRAQAILQGRGQIGGRMGGDGHGQRRGCGRSRVIGRGRSRRQRGRSRGQRRRGRGQRGRGRGQRRRGRRQRRRGRGQRRRGAGGQRQQGDQKRQQETGSVHKNQCEHRDREGALYPRGGRSAKVRERCKVLPAAGRDLARTGG